MRGRSNRSVALFTRSSRSYAKAGRMTERGAAPMSDFYESLDTAAARVIQATARILDDSATSFPADSGRPELAILTLVRAAGWLIGFTAANPNPAHVKAMIDAHCKALRTAATDPLKGREGKELQRQVIAWLRRTEETDG